MRRYISSITPSLFALLVTLCVAVPGFAQSTTIRGGNSANTAAVSNSALSGTEAGLVVRCASGCSGSGGGGAAQADNSALSDITGMGALYDSTPPAVTDGNVGIPRMSSNRNLYVTIRDAAGNERGLNIDASGNLTANITGTVTVGSHAVTNAGTFAVQAAQSGTWNIGSITTLPSLPAGSNNIGDVDVLSLIPGVGATSLGKAEDAAHTTGDTGVMALCVRRDTAATSATTDGDYNPCATDANGALWTNTELPAAAALAENTATPTVPGVGAYGMVYDGTNWDFARQASANNGSADSTTQRVVIAYDSGVCNAKNTSQLAVSVSSSGNNELVALTASQTIYVCDLTLIADGAVDVQLIYGTGTACGTGETNMSGLMKLTAAGAGWTHDYGGRLKTAEANALCLELSGAVAVNGILTYRKAATF